MFSALCPVPDRARQEGGAEFMGGVWVEGVGELMKNRREASFRGLALEPPAVEL